MPIEKELLEILACPACKSDVIYLEERDLIACTNQQCRRKYPIKDGIPIMLIEEAIIEDTEV